MQDGKEQPVAKLTCWGTASNRVLLFKLIFCRLIPTLPTSNVTMDRVLFLYAMVQRMKVDVGLLIYNQILALKSTLVCSKAGVPMESGEERVRPRLSISAKHFEEIQMIGGGRHVVKILEEMKRIREIQEKLLAFVEHQHLQNQTMLTKCNENNSGKSNFPELPESFFAGKPKSSTKTPSPQPSNAKASASTF